jgi:exopolyphosphatase/guanosine-5'-triphosphate,3'-diphosphate pyrophosphatase
MKPERRLVVDIGTNSVLALLVDIAGDGVKVISDKQKTTGLGEGLLKTGRLSNDAMSRTVEAIESFVENAEFDSASLIGTEALRVASNSAEFADIVENKTGQRPVIISGRQEAEFTFRGAILNLDLNPENVVIVDVGGGSTEIIRGVNDRITYMESIPMGALRLRESVAEDRLSAYKEYADDLMSRRNFFDSGLQVNSIIGVGGTITSTAAIAAGLERFDPKIVHGHRINPGKLASIASRFEGINSMERRRLIPFDPQRADLILPGTGIFLAIMGIIGVNELIVSTGGLRFGVAISPDDLLQ